MAAYFQAVLKRKERVINWSTTFAKIYSHTSVYFMFLKFFNLQNSSRAVFCNENCEIVPWFCVHIA